MDHAGVLRQGPDDLRAVDVPLVVTLGTIPPANRGQQPGQVGEQSGLASTQSDFEDPQAPSRSTIRCECALGSGSRSGPLSA